MKHFFPGFLFLILLPLASSAQNAALRNVGPMDVYRLPTVNSPKVSPAGDWILYSVSRADSVKDEFVSKLYMVSIDGKETVQLTEQTKKFSNFNWSPDGKYISFLSAGKKEDEGSQLYLMDRRGGEPMQVTHIKGEFDTYYWFRDAQKLVFAIKDFDYSDTAKTKIRKPYEMDRYQFKDDADGYLDNRKTHLYLFNLETKKLDTLTKGKYNESDVDISSDGGFITYASNVTATPDQNSNTDIFLLSSIPGSKPQQLTFYKGSNFSPRFSPDGKTIAFLQSGSEADFDMYDLKQLGIVDIKSKTTRLLTKNFDRSIETLEWNRNGLTIFAVVEDDRKQNIFQVDVAKGTIEPFTNEQGVFRSLNSNSKGAMAVLYSNPDVPNEIYFSSGNTKFSRVTHIQDEYLKPLRKIYKKGFSAVALDKNVVSGILYLSDSTAKNLPLVLFIHGGPVDQDDYAYDLTNEIYAAAGYAVAAVNYRGSSGRGAEYTKSIYADWGNKEVKDIIGAADYLISQGIADSGRMAIAGWSYGGILTNYTIATDKRFKAAVSGAGSSLMLSFYGTDMYIQQYEPELGKPWENTKKWLDLSYPFFKVKEIRTPTLFMASQNDFNVPVVGAEQMYQAFKSVGIPTQLIIYPNQHHGLSVPSYIVHRYNSHINWFRTYLK
jgi:dipeptidyl aminopeptidase/acylaminoacyl peptidase